ncbi:MAG TPA: ATP-binding protein, partial [Clostridia bacterium]
KIPRLLIQPLIENAVYHGVESKARGKINLHAYLVSGCVRIEVLDDGSGIEEEELEALNDKLSIDNDTYFRNMGSRNRNQSNKSIGIENVNRRIKLFYGDEYGVEIESVSGKYTLAKVTIPYNSECSE